MNLGLITSRAHTDWQARRLTRALGALGSVQAIDPTRLRLIAGRSGERSVLLVLAGERDVRSFDAFVLGHLVGANGDPEIALDAARGIDLLGVPCVNRVGSMLAAQDKLWTAALLARAGVPTPLCSAIPRPGDALVATTEVGFCVAKPLFGSQGDGQFRCESRRDRMRLARCARTGPYLVQRFVRPGGSDYRLFVIGDRVEGCVRRDAGEGEWRTNATRQSRATVAIAHRSWRDVAVEATRALGLEVAGVDLAVDASGPTVLEVNGFPNFRMIYSVTGQDMAPLIAARVAHLARVGRRRSRGGRVRVQQAVRA